MYHNTFVFRFCVPTVFTSFLLNKLKQLTRRIGGSHTTVVPRSTCEGAGWSKCSTGEEAHGTDDVMPTSRVCVEMLAHTLGAIFAWCTTFRLSHTLWVACTH